MGNYQIAVLMKLKKMRGPFGPRAPTLVVRPVLTRPWQGVPHRPRTSGGGPAEALSEAARCEPEHPRSFRPLASESGPANSHCRHTVRMPGRAHYRNASPSAPPWNLPALRRPHTLRCPHFGKRCFGRAGGRSVCRTPDWAQGTIDEFLRAVRPPAAPQ